MACFRITAAVLTVLFLTGYSFTQNVRLVLMESATVVATQQENPPVQGTGSWPILYVDAEKGGSLVIKGVYTDGRRVKTPLRGVIPIWSPDGAWFAYATGEPAPGKTALKVMNLQEDVKTIFSTDKETIPFLSHPIWAPDGGRIAVILSGSPPSAFAVAVIDVREQKVRSRHELPARARTVNSVIEKPTKFRWSPDGRKILLSWKTTVVMDTVTGAIETVAEEPILAEWAPTSDGVYYFDIQGTPRDLGVGDFHLKPLGAPKPIKVMDKEQIKALGLGRQGLAYGLMTLSPKGSTLAIGGSSFPEKGAISVVYIYDLTDRRTVALDKPLKSFRTNGAIVALEWAPDEASLAAAIVHDIPHSVVPELSIKLLNLRTEAWRTLAKVGEEAGGDFTELGLWYAWGHKSMSWTQ